MQNLEDNPKYSDLIFEMKNENTFKEKIAALYRTEFYEHLQNILIEKDSELMKKLNNKVKLILEDYYSDQSFENEKFVKIVKDLEKYCYDQLYKNTYELLSNVWKDYENSASKESEGKFKPLQNSKSNLPKNGQKFTSGVSSNIIYLKNFRKHCANTENAIHSCKGKFLPVLDDKRSVKFVICSGCKQTYHSQAILMHCSPCKVEYYSCHLINYNKEYQPATWEKYHCSALLNDQMKCIKCKEDLFLRMKDGKLACINRRCKFEADPMSIAWTCVLCKKEFKSKAKVYNPMEYKIIKNAIDDALLNKIPAKPFSLPCCKLDTSQLEFFHKDDCRGSVFSGDLSGKQIVVCSACKKMASSEKFIWTCPECLKRFKQKDMDISGEETMRISQATPTTENDVYLKTEGTSPNNNKRFKNISLSLSTNLDKEVDENGEPQTKIKRPVSKEKDTFRSSKFHTPKHSSVMKNFKIMNPVKRAEIDIVSAKNKTIDRSYEIRSPSKNRERLENHRPSYGGIMNARDHSQKLEKTKEFNPFNRSSSNVKSFKELDISNKTPAMNMRESVQTPRVVRLVKYDREEVKNRQNLASNENNFDNEEMNKEDNQQTENVSEESNTVNKLKEFNCEDYSIITLLGEGSFGKIYLVEDNNKNIFSMKKIIAYDEVELESFEQEYELVNQSRHPNILKIIATCKRSLDDTTYALYILMEVGLTDWEKEIKSRQQKKQYYSENELKIIMKQLVSAMAFLQRKNISHRDIKPQNVLVFKDKVYKVADFGEAKQISKLETSKQLSTLRGTELYMSPLLFNALRTNQNDIKHNSFKSDVFSLGFCMLLAATLNVNALYECRNIYETKTLNFFVHKILRNRYSTTFINILCKMMDINEKNRFDFTTLEDILKELEA